MKRRLFIQSGFGALLASFFPFRLLPASGNAVTVYEITGDPALAVSELFSAMGGIGNLIGK